MTTETTTTDATLEADDDNVYCACGTILADSEIDECGEQCTECYAKSHFHCLVCDEDFELDEQSPSNKALCVGCQETRDEEIAQERLDAAKEAAQELLDAILATEDLAVITKALAALKRLAPKS
jgi:hypothetical protein